MINSLCEKVVGEGGAFLCQSIIMLKFLNNFNSITEHFYFGRICSVATIRDSSRYVCHFCFISAKYLVSSIIEVVYLLP